MIEDRHEGLFVPPIANLEAARPLALDDDLAAQKAQFDLANVTARAVNLLGDQRRAIQASASLALHNVFASVDAKSRRRGIEVRQKATSIWCAKRLWT
jgi:hypothetical protein